MLLGPRLSAQFLSAYSLDPRARWLRTLHLQSRFSGSCLLSTLLSKRRQILPTSFTCGHFDRLLVGIKRAIVIYCRSIEEAPHLGRWDPKEVSSRRFFTVLPHVTDEILGSYVFRRKLLENTVLDGVDERRTSNIPSSIMASIPLNP